MKQTNHARLMLILSMAVFGTLAPFVRHIPLTSGELALGRAVLAAGLIALYLLITGQKIPLHGLKKELLLLLLSPVTGEAPLGEGGKVFADVVMYISTFFSLVSCVDYIIRNRDCLKDK